MNRSAKKLLSLLLLLPLSLTTACTGDSNLHNDEPSTSSEETTNFIESSTEENNFVPMFGCDNEYKIVKNTFDSAGAEIFQNFMSELRNKTQIQNIYPSTPSGENANELVIGNIPNYTECNNEYNNLKYLSYSIKFIGNKLVVSYYTPESMAAALKELMSALYQSEDGCWGVSKDIDIYVDMQELSIPKAEITSGHLVGGYISNTKQCQIAFEGSELSDYENYCSLLVKENYKEYSTNKINDNRFSTYVNDTTEIHLIWFANTKQFRIIFGSRGFLPAQTISEHEKLTDATITQIGRYGASNSAAGESYIIQLEDGSYVIIDGGPLNDTDSDNLLNFLIDNKPESHEKPLVIWMFTHLHVDHTDLAVKFLREHYSDIELTMLCYNFPNTQTALKDSLCANTYSLIGSLGRNYPNMKTYIFHSGQKLKLAGCEIEFLYSQEDYWPQKFETANDTSSTWRMNFSDGHNFLVLGDSEKGMCSQMSVIYGDYLESDILQLSHHGLNGATLGLYQYIDPKICFWAIDEKRFLNDPKCLGTHSASYDYNLWLRSTQWTRGATQNERSHYSAGRTVTVRMSDLQTVRNELLVLN